jgi:hypothetical protein
VQNWFGVLFELHRTAEGAAFLPASRAPLQGHEDENTPGRWPAHRNFFKEAASAHPNPKSMFQRENGAP